MTFGEHISNGFGFVGRALVSPVVHWRLSLYGLLSLVWVALGVLLGVVIKFAVNSPGLLVMVVPIFFLVWTLLAAGSYSLSVVRGNPISWWRGFRVTWYSFFTMIILLVVSGFSLFYVFELLDMLSYRLSSSYTLSGASYILFVPIVVIAVSLLYFLIAIYADKKHFVTALGNVLRTWCRAWIESIIIWVILAVILVGVSFLSELLSFGGFLLQAYTLCASLFAAALLYNQANPGQKSTK